MWFNSLWLEDDYSTGCGNVSHCHQQQSYSGPRSPGRSYSTHLWNDSWVQTFHIIFFVDNKNMDMQSCRKGWVIKSVLSFTFKVVQSTGISKKTKVQFFNSFVLTQLANLYQYAKDSEEEREQSIRQAVHEILLKICGSFKFGICFSNTSGAFAIKYALILLTCLTVLYIV